MLTPEKMLNLQEKIKVFCGQSTETVESRVCLSSGTTQKFQSEYEKAKYLNGAFIPQEPWKETSFQDNEIICANPSQLNMRLWNIGSDLGIFRVSDEVLAPLDLLFAKLKISSLITSQEYDLIVKHPDYENAIAHVSQHLEEYRLSNKNLESLGIYVTEPGLRTSTVEDSAKFVGKHFTGLHLDSWDRAPLRRRHKSRNRLCINLGTEDRYFLFINLTLMDMFYALNLSDPEDIYRHYRGTELGLEFMKCFPDYPVVKLKIAPREAYIAPTDNIIHDASSLDKKNSDITLTFIGYFGLPL